MKKKTKSILAIVLAILLLLVVIVTLLTNILFSRKDTPKIFGHYIYLMESDTMEASAGAAVATDVTALGGADVATNGTAVDAESAAASIHKNTAVIASVYSESDPIAKNNAVLCVLAPDDPSSDIDSDRIAVRRIYNIEQDESGVLKYYPTTMQADKVGSEPPITVDNILGKCVIESGELYTFIHFATGVAGILLLLVLPAAILVVMLILTIVRANSKSEDDEYTFEENYDEVFSEDSYDSDFNDEELGSRSPLYHPSENAGTSRSFEQKRSSIAQNFERKQVNPNSPYQKARTMQFKAQRDVPIYTNPDEQIPLDNGYEGAHSTPTSEEATSVFRTRNMDNSNLGAHAAEAPVEPASSYRGSHVADSPEEARNLGSNRSSGSGFGQSQRPAAPAKPVEPKPQSRPAAPTNKYDSASIDELLAMIEDEKKKLDK